MQMVLRPVFSNVDTVFRHLSSECSKILDGLSALFLLLKLLYLLPTGIMLLQQGIMPQAWKQSRITPVHKGGSLTDFDSVVAVVAKILCQPSFHLT